MDNLAVARGGLETDRIGALEDEHLVPGQGERPSRCKADHPGTDHHAFNLVHRIPLAALSMIRCQTTGGRADYIRTR
jgi:hypothetical protein